MRSGCRLQWLMIDSSRAGNWPISCERVWIRLVLPGFHKLRFVRREGKAVLVFLVAKNAVRVTF